MERRITMSKAEKFIQDYTRNCSNEMALGNKDGSKLYNAWLTPDDAKCAVEIAREEMMESACNAYCKVCGHYAHTTPTYICRRSCDYYKDFKQEMK